MMKRSQPLGCFQTLDGSWHHKGVHICWERVTVSLVGLSQCPLEGEENAKVG